MNAGNPRRTRINAAFVVVGTLALYASTAGGSLTSTDAVVSFDLTRSIVDQHSIALSGDLLGLGANRGVDGRYYSQYGIGQSLYNVPFYIAGNAAQRLIHRRIGKPDTLPKAAVALGSAVAAAIAVLLVWYLSLQIGATARASVVAAASAAVASPLWPYSKFGFSTALTAVILLGAACLLLEASARASVARAAAAGAVIGFGWLTRHEMALVLLPFVAFVLLEARDRRTGWRLACAFVACAGAGGAIWAWYNFIRFGSPLSVGYAPAMDFSGYAAFLVSPAGSLLVFAPIVLLWIVGLLRANAMPAARRVLLAGPLVVFYLFYGALADWAGGRSYGPRYLVPALMLLAPGAALVWDSRALRHRTIAVVIVCAALLQLPGVLVDYSKVSVEWARTATKEEIDERNWHVASSPFVLGARAALRAVPANVAYLAGRQPPSLETVASTDNRDFAQQLSFSLDFWWMYLFYLRAITARAALSAGAGLMIVASACGMGAWRTSAGLDRGSA
jgi:hypothetical protein